MAQIESFTGANGEEESKLTLPGRVLAGLIAASVAVGAVGSAKAKTTSNFYELFRKINTNETQEKKLSNEEADKLLQEYQAAKQKLTEIKNTAAGEEYKEANVKKSELERYLPDLFSALPSREYRERAINLLHPDMNKYAEILSNIEYYPVIFNPILMTMPEEWWSKEDTKEQLSRVVDAVKFIDNEGGRILLIRLMRAEIINLFEHPELIGQQGWDLIIKIPTNEFQGKTIGDAVRRILNRGSIIDHAGILSLARSSSWIQNETQEDLINISKTILPSELLQWKNAFEDLIKPVPVSIKTETGKTEVVLQYPHRAIEAVKNYLLSTRAEDSLVPERIQKAGEIYQNAVNQGAKSNQ